MEIRRRMTILKEWADGGRNPPGHAWVKHDMKQNLPLDSTVPSMMCPLYYIVHNTDDDIMSIT